MPDLRSDNRKFFLLGTVPTVQDRVITGCRLPTHIQVLLCFLSHHEDMKIRDAANATVSAVQPFYWKARIPMLAPHKMAEEVEKLYKEMQRLQKINTDARVLSSNQEKILNFKSKLGTTMKFWPKNAIDRIEKQEDKDFLVKMIEDRDSGTLGSVDIVLAVKEKKVSARKEKGEKRRETELLRRHQAEAVVSMDEVPEENDEDKVETDNIFTAPTSSRSHKRIKKQGTPGFFTHDVAKHPAVVESCVRNNISPAAQSDLFHSMIIATGGDPKKVTLHYTSLYRFRMESVITIASKIKEAWVAPSRGVVHWDGKLMDSLSNEYSVEERLPILLSGVGGVKPLGVLAIPHKLSDKTGTHIGKATKEQLDAWDCAANVTGMVFDTTSSNTGAISAMSFAKIVYE